MRWLKTVNGSRNNICKQLFSSPPISFLAILHPFCPLTSYSQLPHSVWLPLHLGTSGELLRYPIATDINPRILPLSALHHPVYHDEHRPHDSNLSRSGLFVLLNLACIAHAAGGGKTEPSCSEEVLVLGPDSVTPLEFVGADEGGTASRAKCGLGDNFTPRGSLEAYWSNLVAKIHGGLSGHLELLSVQYIAGSSPTDPKMRRKTTSKVNPRPRQTLPRRGNWGKFGAKLF
ncbi:hypothetical protein B0H13DRAFT_1855584 [Mycena leptocephala]|nr:hypothetical protein B0H13DRAFT_1855584 [Mycena leptocephala]